MTNVFRFTFLLFSIPLLVFGQEHVMYTPEFQFQNGIYLSFQDFKNNNPVPLTHILSDLDIRSADYLELVLATDSVTYFDNMYEERILAVENLWGFCQRGRVFIGFGKKRNENSIDFFDFYPLLNIGAYSFFTAVEAHYRTMSVPQIGIGFRDPMMKDDVTVRETGQVQMLLNFNTGRVLLASRGELKSIPVDMIVNLISSDATLLSEYESLLLKEQKTKGVFFLRRFNKRNPIFFPNTRLK